MIRARLLRSNLPPVEAEAADRSALSADDANILWIDLEAPSEEEFAQVIRRLDIDPRAAQAARSVGSRPGVLTHEQHYLVMALDYHVHPRVGWTVFRALPTRLASTCSIRRCSSAASTGPRGDFESALGRGPGLIQSPEKPGRTPLGRRHEVLAA